MARRGWRAVRRGAAGLAALFFCLSTPVFSADDPWSSADVQRQAAFYVLHAVDWGQTRTIAIEHERWNEINPLIGIRDRYSVERNLDRVDRYFVLTAALHYVVADYLPAEYRPWFQYITIAERVGVVGRNYAIGIRVSF